MIQALVAQALVASSAHAQTRLHRSPKPLSDDAVTHDWTSFLGPSSNAVSTETHLSQTLPPPLVWEFGKGSRLRLAGHRRFASGVHPSIGERRDRRVSAPGDRVTIVAVPLRKRLPGPVRL